MDLTHRVERVDGVTLVALQVTNDDGATRRVRVENRLDGPVWFPRSGGVAVPGWDADGYTGVLDAGERRPLGYATPAPPRDPAAEVVASDPVDDERTVPEAVLADLGDPRPPADAVAPTRAAGAGGADGRRER